MGTLIAKLAPDCYVEWSSVVDAPVTTTMTRAELESFVREEYGEEGLRKLPERLERVEKNGTSSLHGSTLESLLCVNRAGENEARITLAEIIERYTVQRSTGGEG